MRSNLSRLLAAVLFLALSTSAEAQQWTRFRGPNGNGQSDAANIPVQWSPGDYNWKIDLPGIGHSSPVIWGERVFVTSADPKSGDLFVICVAADDGRKLWQKRFASDPYHLHVRNSFASSTPAVDGERLYITVVTPEHYRMIALTHEGEVAWRVDLGGFVSQHGYGISPMLYEDLVIVGNDNRENSFLAALDRATGEERWRVECKSDRAAYSTPCVRKTASGGEELIFNSSAHGITAVDPRTGKVNWEIQVFDKRSVSSPILAGGLVFGSCGSGGGGNFVVAVRPGDGGKKPKLAYKIDKSAPYVPTPVACGDLVFLWSDKGVVTCIDAATGEVHYRKRVGGNYSGSPVCVDGRLYCIAEDGEVVVLAASKEFKPLARNPLGDDSRATPAVADGTMYLRTYHTLVSLGGK